MLSSLRLPTSGVRLVALQVVGTLAVLYLALEVWAQLFPPKDQLAWPQIQVPGVGTTFGPHARVVLGNGLDFSTEERTNEAGFLDRPLPPIARRPGSCRVALVGDSFVEAAQVKIGQKAQVELQRLMTARWPDLPVDTMAVGFSGTGQLNQLGYFDAFVRPRKPDLVVLVFVSNDFVDNSALLDAIRVGWHPAHAPRIFAREASDGTMSLQPTDAGWLGWRLPAAVDKRPWLHEKLFRISRFYRWVFAQVSLKYPDMARRMNQAPTEADLTDARVAALVKLDPSYARLLAGWDPNDGPGIDHVFDRPGSLPPAFEQAVRFTGYAFDLYKQRAAADGAKLVVLATHEVKGEAEQRVRKLLADRQIPYVSLTDYVARHGGNIDDAHFRHDNHWSPQGHTWAAEALVEKMAADHICGRS